MKRWPSLLEEPTARGRIREQVEDFVVQEIPAYDPCGEGKHLFIEVEKTGLTSEQVVAAVAFRSLALQASVPIDNLCELSLQLTQQWRYGYVEAFG